MPSCWTPGPAISSPETPRLWGWIWGLWPSASSPTPTGTTPTGWTLLRPERRRPLLPPPGVRGRPALTTSPACGGMRAAGACWPGSPPGSGTWRGLLPLPGVTLLPPPPSAWPKGSGRRDVPPGGGASGSPTISPTSRPWCWTPPAAWSCATAALPRRGGHRGPGGPGRLPRPAHPGHCGGFHLYATPDQEVGPWPAASGTPGWSRSSPATAPGAGVCPAPGGAGGAGGAVLHRAGGGTVRQTPHCVASVGGPVKPAQVETCDVVSAPIRGGDPGFLYENAGPLARLAEARAGRAALTGAWRPRQGGVAGLAGRA